jgi:hypothetical protein
VAYFKGLSQSLPEGTGASYISSNLSPAGIRFVFFVMRIRKKTAVIFHMEI